MIDKNINLIKEKLQKYGVSYDDFVQSHLLNKNFFVPKKIAKLSGTRSDEELFYLLTISIYAQCDLLTGQKASLLEQETYDEWLKKVGEKRGENFKLAIYEELKFRLYSNTFPEFSSQQELVNPIYSLKGEQKQYNIIAQVLSPQSANFIINSYWNLLDFEGVEPLIKNLNDYLKEIFEPRFIAIETKASENEKKLNDQVKKQSNDAQHFLARLTAERAFTNTELSNLQRQIDNKYAEYWHFSNIIWPNHKSKVNELENKQNETLKNLENFKNKVEQEQQLQNQDIQSATELTNEVIVKTSELENSLNAIKANVILNKNLIDEKQTSQDEEIQKAISRVDRMELDIVDLQTGHSLYALSVNERIDKAKRDITDFKEEVTTKLNEFRENNSNSSNSAASNASSIPDDILTESNLNSKSRTLSALTIIPGNGTHNSSIFLKNNKANWEFYADANNGSFGVWDKLKNREAFNISSERKVDFYNEVNAHGFKLINLGDPSVEKDAANKKYVDNSVGTIQTDLNNVKSSVAAAVSSLEKIKTDLSAINNNSSSDASLSEEKVKKLARSEMRYLHGVPVQKEYISSYASSAKIKPNVRLLRCSSSIIKYAKTYYLLWFWGHQNITTFEIGTLIRNLGGRGSYYFKISEIDRQGNYIADHIFEIRYIQDYYDVEFYYVKSINVLNGSTTTSEINCKFMHLVSEDIRWDI